jgi:predicted lipid carrier protein YhbT
LITTAALALQWHLRPGFERILVAETPEQKIDFPAALQQLVFLYYRLQR